MISTMGVPMNRQSMDGGYGGARFVRGRGARLAALVAALGASACSRDVDDGHADGGAANPDAASVPTSGVKCDHFRQASAVALPGISMPAKAANRSTRRYPLAAGIPAVSSHFDNLGRRHA